MDNCATGCTCDGGSAPNYEGYPGEYVVVDCSLYY
jgi:hypothetical protein